MALSVPLRGSRFLVRRGSAFFVRPIRVFMICEDCKKREAIVDWNYFTPSGTEEHANLCQACADARTPPQALRQIREAQAGGQKVVSGWTSYNPIRDEDGRSSA